MSDQSKLDFIRKISEAIDSPNPSQSLERVFTEIANSDDSQELENFKILIEQSSMEVGSSNTSFITMQGPPGVHRKVPLKANQSVFVDDIPPGHYTICLWSGREIWSGPLLESWLITEPSEEIRLAASTEPGEPAPVHRLDLLDGEIAVEFFAGYETGRARVRWIRDQLDQS